MILFVIILFSSLNSAIASLSDDLFPIESTEDKNKRKRISNQLCQGISVLNKDQCPFTQTPVHIDHIYYIESHQLSSSSRLSSRRFSGDAINVERELIGGIMATQACWNSVDITSVWVHEKYRAQGYGRKLFERLENEACEYAKLSFLKNLSQDVPSDSPSDSEEHNHINVIINIDVYNWQSPSFLQALGYKLQAEIKDRPKPGFTRYIYDKILEVEINLEEIIEHKRAKTLQISSESKKTILPRSKRRLSVQNISRSPSTSTGIHRRESVPIISARLGQHSAPVLQSELPSELPAVPHVISQVPIIAPIPRSVTPALGEEGRLDSIRRQFHLMRSGSPKNKQKNSPRFLPKA